MAITKQEKNIIRVNIASRIEEIHGTERVLLNAEELALLESKGNSRFYQSLYQNAKDHEGYLTFNQFVYVYREVPQFTIDTRTHTCIIEDVPRQKTQKITLTVTIEKVDKYTFKDNYNYSYRGWGHVNTTDKKVYKGRCNDRCVIFYENKHTTNIEASKTYKIEARVKYIDDQLIKINYIKAVEEIANTMDFRGGAILYPEDLVSF